MKKRFEDFIKMNESLFGSKNEKIVKKLYNYISNMDPSNIIHISSSPLDDEYIFTISDKCILDNENDPYGEETYGEMNIKMTRFWNSDPELFLDGEKIKINFLESNRLFKLIKNVHYKYKLKLKREEETQQKIRAKSASDRLNKLI